MSISNNSFYQKHRLKTDLYRRKFMDNYDVLYGTNKETDEEYRIHPLLNLNELPSINVLDSKTFQGRVSEIFQMTSDALSKSYGPYGSSTIISDYPYNHITKDGFSIMKKLSFSKDVTIVDDAIKSLIEAPCSRLNYAVGDGTTTAIIAVNEIYQNFMMNKNNIEIFNLVPPRDILKAYNSVRDEIIEALDDEIEFIDVTDHEKMVEAMRKVATISSNADDEIVSMITQLYDELDYPLIDITKASDGITKATITRGYHYNAVLKDAIYVTNDNFTGEYQNVDILIFDHKITMETFKSIIYPLNEECRKVKRHLVIIAPSYDDVAMMNVRRNLNGEFKAMNDVNLILMAGSMTAGLNRDLCEDFAIVLNTTIINMGLEKDIIDAVNNNHPITDIIDINCRKIPGIAVSVVKDGKIGWTTDTGSIPDENINADLVSWGIRAGFAEKAVLGMKDGSTFDGLHYNQQMYDSAIRLIKHKLQESQKKSEAINAYNFEAKNLQTRLFNLQMKIGTIEVGGESNLSQEMMNDVVDDAVKACASAYHNGLVKGCSVSTLRAIKSVKDKGNHTEIENILLNCIDAGFRSVYTVLLNSVFQNVSIVSHYSESNKILHRYDYHVEINQKSLDEIYDYLCSITRWNVDKDRFKDALVANVIRKRANPASKDGDDAFITINGMGNNLFNLIINLSIYFNRPFDLTTRDFNPDIVNSAKTDKEVLLASSDLISLLITGNQFVIADH